MTSTKTDGGKIKENKQKTIEITLGFFTPASEVG